MVGPTKRIVAYIRDDLSRRKVRLSEEFKALRERYSRYF